MIRVDLEENKTTRVQLTQERVRQLHASDVVTVALSTTGQDLWDLSPGRRVGVVRIGDMEVWIKPKLTVSRLLFLVGYANQRRPQLRRACSTGFPMPTWGDSVSTNRCCRWPAY